MIQVFNEDTLQELLNIPDGTMNSSQSALLTGTFYWFTSDEGYEYWHKIASGASPWTERDRESITQQAVLAKLLDPHTE